MQRIWKGIPLQIARIYPLLYIVYRFYLVFQANKVRLNVEKSRFELYTFQLDFTNRNVYEKTNRKSVWISGAGSSGLLCRNRCF